MVILCVNDENFLPALDTFGKNADHADAGLQPAATSRFRLRRTAPAAALWSLVSDLGRYYWLF